MSDLTSKKKSLTGELLKVSELRYRRLFEAAQDGILILDAKTGMIEDVNPFLINLLGYSREEFVKKKLWEVGAFRDIEASKDAFEALQDNQYIRYEDLPLKTKGGQLIQVEFVSNVYLVGEEKVIQCNIRDITERKRAEEALQKNEKYFRALMKHSLEEISLIDRDGTLTFESPNMHRPLGYPPNSFVGHNIFDLFHPDEREAAAQLLEQVVKHPGSGQEAQFRLRQQDGSWRWMEGTITNLLDEPEVQSIVINYRDITGHKLAEDERNQSESLFRALFELSPDSIVLIDPHDPKVSWPIIDCNKAACTINGYRRDELIEHSIDILNGMVGPQAERTAYLDRLREAGFLKYEVLHRRKDGTIFPVEVSTALFEIGGRELVLGIDRDITERKQAEQALRASEEKFSSVFQHAPIPMSLGVIEDGMLIEVNDKFAESLGLPRNEIIGRTQKELGIIAPEDETRFAQIMRDKGRIENIEVVVHSKDNRERIILISGEIIVLDGKPRMLTSAIDITERARAEQTLQLQSTALNAAANGMVITDRAGIIEWVNPAFTTLTGYTADEAIGQNPRALVRSARQSQAFYKDMWDTILNGEIWHGELVNRRKDGGLYTEEQTITPLKDARGKISHFIAIKQDITKRKEAESELLQYRQHLEELVTTRTSELIIAREQAEAANHAKGDFLAVMSHEIRTPLNGVLGMAQMIMQTELTDKQRNYLTNLKISGETLMTTINDILDYSRLDSGKLTLEEVNFDLEDVLRNLSSNVAYRAQEKGLELVFNIAPDVPSLLVGDPTRIGQVLLNLVGNAIKFTKAGDIVVRIRLVGLAPDSATLEFSVKDTGIGMMDEHLAQLFEPFSQADSSTSRKYGGSGLGLTISQRFVRLMGGEIRVESQFGKGSIFSFRLNLGRQAARQPEPAGIIPDLVGRHILVVDDNPETLDAIRSTLESFALKVTIAQTSEAGLTLLAEPEPEAPIELVLMDLDLPGSIDGLEAIRHMKQDPKLKQIPAILLASAEEMVRQPENSEVDGYLVKPLTRSKLLDVVTQKLVNINSFMTKRVAAPPISEDLEKLKGAQILLVEDNQINQIVAMEMLKMLGIQVSIANNGGEALEMIKKTPFDAVLMDIHMPGQDGYEVTAQIRADERFTYERLPVIAMTADAMAGDRNKALQAGMNDYVSKPVDVGALTRALLRWVNRGANVGTVSNWEPETTVTLPISNEVLDMDKALLMLGGNKELYLRILRLFRDGHAHTADAIRAALRINDLELARRLAHSLKGVAGQIGAERVRSAAKDLEMAIAEGNTAVYDEQLAGVEQKLADVIASIANIL